jgi:hypothetical protein
MNRTTITSVRGLPLPNLEAMGLHKEMKPLAALIEEEDKLRRRAQELGYERQELQERIKRLEHERTRQWGAAIRAGEEAPTDEAIEAAKKRLEEVRKEAVAVRHAGDLADSELRQTHERCSVLHAADTRHCLHRRPSPRTPARARVTRSGGGWMSGDLERSAEQERADTDRKHGEHILSIMGCADKSRDETTRSLLDAISRARLAQEGNQE